MYTVQVYSVQRRNLLPFISFPLLSIPWGPCNTFKINQFLQLSSSKFLSHLLLAYDFVLYQVNTQLFGPGQGGGCSRYIEYRISEEKLSPKSDVITD
jgi:hypothetical protein